MAIICQNIDDKYQKKPRKSQQHGQAGFADASPKFCNASLCKTSAVPGTVVCNKFTRGKESAAGNKNKNARGTRKKQ
jgi:hypothetical protein